MGELLVWLFVAALVFVIVQAIWLPALILLCAVIAAYVGLKIIGRVAAMRQADEARVAALVQRADREHAAIMRGDLAAGTYGQYPVPDDCCPFGATAAQAR
ncbi:hypothetical protein [Mycobacterium terramassiliense]|uniref:Uncharacterized protein n=1 Tax=Mycobacterium terramassiliense TaxID=1841859 RepID=A0A2U3NJ72_9MYCO|nr:hypothetical protein [Mycobacterium terramassiliense]SPM31578.1 hypothetical protein SNENIA_32 [Mycobacterium terramassiliense]